MTRRTWLRKLRISRGLTQDAVASHAYINRGFYSQIENGTRRPSLHVAGNIAKTLGCSPKLFWLDDAQNGTGKSSLPEALTVFSHNNLELKYTWLWSPYGDFDECIGKYDDELYDDCVELINVKQHVIKHMTTVEKVIQLRYQGKVRSYLAKSKPLLNLDGGLIGTSNAISQVQSAPTTQRTVQSSELGQLEGHVVYFYESLHRYLDHVVKFIVDGVTSEQEVWVIEQLQLQTTINVELQRMLGNDNLKLVHYIDYTVFDDRVSTNKMAELNKQAPNLQSLFAEHRTPVRVWAHFDFKADDTFISHAKVTPWEDAVERIEASPESTIVCAYNAMETSASVQMAMLRHHKHFMTDLELATSPLYTKGNSDAIFQTLAGQARTKNKSKHSPQEVEE